MHQGTGVGNDIALPWLLVTSGAFDHHMDMAVSIYFSSTLKTGCQYSLIRRTSLKQRSWLRVESGLLDQLLSWITVSDVHLHS